MIDRRTVLPLLGAAIASPSTMARAQKPHRIPRIGVITTAGKTEGMLGPETANTSLAALLLGLRDLGYVYGRDFKIEPRGGQSTPVMFPGLVAELIATRPDVIVAPTPLLKTLRDQAGAIPIVMAGAEDPVTQGYIQSLARPGGTFTGLSNLSVELTGKRLEMLKEIAPAADPVGVLWDEQSQAYWQAAESVAKARGWRLLSLEIRNPADIDKAFRTATNESVGGVLVHAAGLLFGRAPLVTQRLAASRLPAMFATRNFVDAGGLMSYAANLNDLWRRSAVFVDKILKGAKPADIPVEQPTKFELVINGKTAKALGLTIPPTLLAFATEVIE
jgi:putative tryptophan/tyrosine transport system substrate-binding protein